MSDLADALQAMIAQSAHTQTMLADVMKNLTTTNTGSSSTSVPKYDESDDFENFILKFEAVADVYNFSEQKKIATFVTSIPGSTFQLLRNLLHPEEFSKVTFVKIKDVLTKHLKPKPLIIPARHAFLQRKQHEGESLSDYMADLRRLAIPCQYTDTVMNIMLRDVFVAGIRSRSILDRIFEEDNTPLDKIYQIAIAIEKAEMSTREMLHSNTQPQVNKVNKSFVQKKQSSATASTSKGCLACGDRSHTWHECKQKHKLFCKHCNIKGHAEHVCIKKKKEQFQHNDRRRVHNLQDTDDDEELHVYKIKALNTFKAWRIQIAVQGHPISMEVDSGSGATFLPESLYNKFKRKVKLQPTDVEFHPYGDGTPRITPLGVAHVQASYKEQRAILPLYVLEGNCTPLIGRQWLEELNILKMEDLHCVGNLDKRSTDVDFSKEFPELFTEGIGLAKDFTASLVLKPDAMPVFRKARPVPFALRERIESELDRLVSERVLESVPYSEYAAPIVPVIQGESVRICADYSSGVNNQLEIPHYPLPKLDELLSTISGCKIFAKLDIKKAYLSLPLDSKSSEILTINTHKGLYRPRRLMFGCASAPVIWTRYIDRVLQNIPGIAVFFDDILLGAKTRDELNRKLRLVLQRLQDNGLRLNLQKCEFLKESVKYLGHIISSKGIQKSQERVEAIVSTPTPTTISELKSFLGIVTFYGRYFPDMATVAAPLYEATKGNKLQWTKQCEKSFQMLKKELTSDRVLAPYDPELPVTLCCDAGPVGIGAVLQHTYPDGTERPIIYIHKKLNKSQMAYSQIDKEAYSIKYAVEKLHHFLIGREFTLYTDHRPLVHIFGQQRSKLPPLCATRLLHYALFLQNFKFTIKYRKSSEHGNADFLSRLPTHSSQLENPDTLEKFQIQHMSVLPVSPKDIASETTKDPELRELLFRLRRGDTFPAEDGQYSLQSGCILKGMRVFIPRKYRQGILEELHAGHLGIVKVKALARGLVYWKNIDRDIERMCSNCATCKLYKTRPAKAATHYWEYPSHPWERIHMDFASFGGRNYLLIIDAHSKWPEIFITKDQTSQTVMTVLDSLFARYGLPLAVVSDNQTSFVGRDIQRFYNKYGVRHITSPVAHAASNGQCERFVSSLKCCLRTLQHSTGTPQQKLQQFLSAYRRAPHVTTGVSPAALFLKRELRTQLDLGRPNIQSDYNAKVRKGNIILKTPVFTEGQNVAVRSYVNPLKKWALGKIVTQDGDLQYTVLVNGELHRRHADQLRPVGDDIVLSQHTTPTVRVNIPSQTTTPTSTTTTPPEEVSAEKSTPAPAVPVVTPTVTRSVTPPEQPAPTAETSKTPAVHTPKVPHKSPSLAERRTRRQINKPKRLNL